MLSPQIFFLLITITTGSFKVFDSIRIMTGGGPDGSSEVFLFYMYDQAYTNSTYGYGMAIGVIVFIFSFALSSIINRATKREVLEF